MSATDNRRGATRLGALCREGHEHERTGRSLRYCAGGQCVRCSWEWNHGFRQVETERRLANSTNF